MKSLYQIRNDLIKMIQSEFPMFDAYKLVPKQPYILIEVSPPHSVTIHTTELHVDNKHIKKDLRKFLLYCLEVNL